MNLWEEDKMQKDPIIKQPHKIIEEHFKATGAKRRTENCKFKSLT